MGELIFELDVQLYCQRYRKDFPYRYLAKELKQESERYV